MASYIEWNQALISYFLSGVPQGSKVYLSVDDEVIERIGQNFSTSPRGGIWGDDFRAAVREKVIFEEKINLSSLQGRDSNGLPCSVAFLGVTVLAAYHMGDRELSDKNYFTQLRQLLELPTSKLGRPLGIEHGYEAEEPLWEKWNFWLGEHGFLSSARQGEGSKIYINYPISQSLLRCTDKDRLRRLFAENHWTSRWDSQTLAAYVCQESKKLTKHLKELLNGSRQRYEAVSEAIHEVYKDSQENGSVVIDKPFTYTWSRDLYADLYRTEDFLGEVEYYLYPRQPKGLKLEQVQVQREVTIHTIFNERPGWYMPTLPVDAGELTKGARHQIISPSNLQSLILQQRDFWLLVPDPEDPDTPVYASWQAPKLGESFILLCKQELLPDLERLRNQSLMQWSGEPQLVPSQPTWVELHQCMIVLQDWDEVIINRVLKEALQPRDSLSISLSGGLRVPNAGGWLDDHEPLVTIFSFYPKAKLQVIRLSDNHKVVDGLQRTNAALSVAWAGPGDYLLRASYSGEPTERLVKIVDWNQLAIEVPQHREMIGISSWQICGSVIGPISKYK